jgi:hypothetical protein
LISIDGARELEAAKANHREVAKVRAERTEPIRCQVLGGIP